MKTVELKHVIQKDKELDKHLLDWLDDVKKEVHTIDGDRVFIQTRIREAKDGDVRVSTIIGIKD